MNSLKQIGFLITTTALVTSCGFVSTNQGDAKTPEPSITAVSSPTASPTPELRTISIFSSGDILLHERLWAQAKADGTDGN
jgi:hypothetical protein